MGGCSLARMISQPESPARATAKRAARVPTAPAAANLAPTGASSRRSRAAVEPPAERRASAACGAPACVALCLGRVGARGCRTAGVRAARLRTGRLRTGPRQGRRPGGGTRAGAAGAGGGRGVGILDSGSGGRARGAGCHCHDVVGEFPGLPVVGHQQDGDLSAERGDGAADGGGGFPVQVGGGFIEQQHTGSRLDPGEAAGQRDAAQLPRAELGGMLRGEVLRGAGCQAAQGAWRRRRAPDRRRRPPVPRQLPDTAGPRPARSGRPSRDAAAPRRGPPS